MNFVPTTEQVREIWVDSVGDAPTPRLHAGAAFDRWLGDYDRTAFELVDGEEWNDGSLAELLTELAARLVASGKNSIRATDAVFGLEHKGVHLEFTADIICKRIK